MEFFRQVAGAPKPVGPYSAAVQTHGLVFCAGQIGLDPETGSLVAGGVAEQTKQVLQNIQAVLKAAGSSPERIAMTTIFLTNITDGKIVNELYADFVDQANPPARQTVAVKDLPLGALVEISVIAIC